MELIINIGRRIYGYYNYVNGFLIINVKVMNKIFVNLILFFNFCYFYEVLEELRLYFL